MFASTTLQCGPLFDSFVAVNERHQCRPRDDQLMLSFVRRLVGGGERHGVNTLRSPHSVELSLQRVVLDRAPSRVARVIGAAGAKRNDVIGLEVASNAYRNHRLPES
jgi:hypothetical protein